MLAVDKEQNSVLENAKDEKESQASLQGYLNWDTASAYTEEKWDPPKYLGQDQTEREQQKTFPPAEGTGHGFLKWDVGMLGRCRGQWGGCCWDMGLQMNTWQSKTGYFKIGW